MNMIFKNFRYILLIVFGLCLSLMSINSAQANFIAGPATGSIEIVCAVPDLCGSNIGKLQLAGVRGLIGISVWSQSFNFVISNENENIGNLTLNGNVLVGSKLTYSSSAVSFGSWWMSGGAYDTPDMNGNRYRLRENGGSHPPNSGVPGVAIYPPTNSTPISIYGSGAVNCNSLVCTANTTGAAYITVIFPAGQARAEAFPKYPDQDINCPRRFDCGTDTKEISYGQQIRTISFNVYDSKNMPLVTYKDNINIGTSTVTSRWNYSDIDGDKQTESQLRLYKDVNRTELAQETITQSGELTNINITGLQTNTTYYPSVRVRNNPDGWTNWVDGPEFKTQDDTNETIGTLKCVISESSLDWDPFSEGSQLVIRYREVNNLTWDTYKHNENLASLPLSRFNLEKGKEYEFQMRYETSSISSPCGNITILNDLPKPVTPVVSCSIKDNKRAVSASDSKITLIINVGNISNYEWQIGNGTPVYFDLGDILFNNKLEDRSEFEFEIDYGSVPFGRYTPWVEVSGLETRQPCGTIVNFGRTKIKEISR